MATLDRERFEAYREDDEVEESDFSEGERSDSECDSDNDPSYDAFEDRHCNSSKLSNKKKSGLGIKEHQEKEEIDSPKLDEKSYETVKKIIEAGQIKKLRLNQCKIYLRKYGLRLSGKKEVLIERIKEHLEISNGGGEKKYPASSFVLNCKGDACTGDVVMFEQNVYEMFNIASRSASGPPCGTRIVAGRIVKESYGAAKQQHTFTIEVLWSKGEKPFPPLHPLLIKGRNLYRLKTLRQRWGDEGERQKILMEKHSRGSVARSFREMRIQDKERRNMLKGKANRILKKEGPNNHHDQKNLTEKMEIRHNHSKISARPGVVVAPLPQKENLSTTSERFTNQTQKSSSSSTDIAKPTIRSQVSAKSGEGVIGPPRQALNHQQTGLSAASAEPRVQPPKFSDFPPLQTVFKCEEKDDGMHYRNGNQSPCNMVPDRGIHGVHLQKRYNEYQTDHREKSGNYGYPNNNKAMSKLPERSYHPPPLPSKDFYPPLSPRRMAPMSPQRIAYERFTDKREPNRNYGSPINHEMRKLPEQDYHRRPLTSMNQYHYHQLSPLRGQIQLCRYYAQGRCKFGDNCRYLHESRPNLREERWSHDEKRIHGPWVR